MEAQRRALLGEDATFSAVVLRARLQCNPCFVANGPGNPGPIYPSQEHCPGSPLCPGPGLPESPNYAPQPDPDIRSGAYSPVSHHSAEESDDTVILNPPQEQDETPPGRVFTPPPGPFVRELDDDEDDDVVFVEEFPPAPPMPQRLIYFPVPGSTPDEPNSIFMSDPMVQQLLSSATHHEYVFLPPPSTVHIAELSE